MNSTEEQKKEGHAHEKEVTIIVNARPKVVTKKEMTFEEIVALAFDGSEGPNTLFTVTYSKGEDRKPTGTLVAGESVKIKEGMVFNVKPTVRS